MKKAINFSFLLSHNSLGSLVALLVLLLASSTTFAQSLPITFESDVSTEDFIDFDGGQATVIANPHMDAANPSASVAQIVRNGGQIWGGSKIELDENLDFSTMNRISMKVYTAAPVGTMVKLKLEGGNAETEVDVFTTVSNAWETLEWNFTGRAPIFNALVFMFDFGNVGDGSETSTFLFDDIEQVAGGRQIDLPVTFNDPDVDYTMTDFGGNVSELVVDPTNPNNNVMQVTKTSNAELWAGTTIGTNQGFASTIPLTLSSSKMTVRVWSPDAGIPIRLKVEDANDPTHTCETETLTTVAGEWETLEFDFSTEAPGTAPLSVGVSMGWVFNMASIFFNFGTEGSAVGEKTYFFDEVRFGDLSTSAITYDHIEGLHAFPNPTQYSWTIETNKIEISLIEIFDLHGRLIYSGQPYSTIFTIDASNFVTGAYIARMHSNIGAQSVRLIKK